MLKSNFYFDFTDALDSTERLTESYGVSTISMINAIERSSILGLMLIDFENYKFDYVSQTPMYFGGYGSDEIKLMGFDFFRYIIPENDLLLMERVLHSAFHFYKSVEKDKALHFTLCIDLNITNKKGGETLVNKKLTPVQLDKTGRICRAITVVSLSSAQEPGNAKLFESNANCTLNYDLVTDKWVKTIKVVLSERENQILQLSMRGYTIDEIGNIIFVSPDTVKFHRKKLFEKLNVNNISEAITHAINYRIITDN